MFASVAARRAVKTVMVGTTAVASSQILLLWRQPGWRVAAASPAGAVAHDDINSVPHAKTVFVIGAGVAGICSAYKLACRGYEVFVIDGRDGAAAPGSASATAAGGMERKHKFSTGQNWKDMFRQLVPGLDRYTFFYISWLDVVGDLFFWRWLLRFAGESLLASTDHIEAKKNCVFSVGHLGY